MLPQTVTSVFQNIEAIHFAQMRNYIKQRQLNKGMQLAGAANEICLDFNFSLHM